EEGWRARASLAPLAPVVARAAMRPLQATRIATGPATRTHERRTSDTGDSMPSAWTHDSSSFLFAANVNLAGYGRLVLTKMPAIFRFNAWVGGPGSITENIPPELAAV